jgi:hypothetical protein
MATRFQTLSWATWVLILVFLALVLVAFFFVTPAR